MALEFNVTNEEKVTGVTFSPISSTGRPAQIQPGSLDVSIVSGDGTTSPGGGSDTLPEFLSGDNPGDTVFLVKADADLGDGVVEISDTVTLHVVGALAANLGLGGGSVVPK
jgi:hypothetical protein